MSSPTAGEPELEGKRVLVTGASRGIGAAIASCCAAKGAVVGVGFKRSEEAARSLVARIGEAGGHAIALHLDLGEPEACARSIASFADDQGGLDGLVNNAAVTVPGLLVGLPLGTMRDALDVNLLGPIVCTQAALVPMLLQRSGVIVSIGSVAAARPSAGQSVYAAAKGALESFTRAVAVEYGRRGIRAHCVRPGAIDTEMLRDSLGAHVDKLLPHIALRRLGSPTEIGELVAFLLSDRCPYLSGEVIAVDGAFL